MGYPEILNRYRQTVETALSDSLRAMEGPSALKEAMAYSLMAGGKRIKSVLLLAVREMFPEGGPDPLPAACAFECIHTYSLIHDDLPAMDDDDFRRGRPSNHKAFGEALAILAGDALLTEAFVQVSAAYRGAYADIGMRVLHEIARAAGSAGMVGGQVLDTLGTGKELDLDGLRRVHAMKTGALFRGAIRCGAILGGATDDELDAVTDYAERVGLAFQVADDILDETQSTETLGKTAGKDREQAKNTYVAHLGLAKSRDYARRLIDEACKRLSPFGENARPLCDLGRFIVERTN